MMYERTEELANKVWELRKDGLSISEVADICCRSYALISLYSRYKAAQHAKNGGDTQIKREKCGAKRRYKAEYVKKVKAGKTYTETAELLGLSVTTVRNYLKR